MAVKSTALALDERFRVLCQSAPIGIFTTDADGRTTYVNRRYEEIFGTSLEETLRGSWISLIHPDDRDAAYQERSRCAREGTEYVHEHRLARPTGEIRWVRARAAPMFADGGTLLGYVGTVEDITDEKAAAALRTEAEARRRVAQVLLELGHVVSQSASPAAVAERVIQSARVLLGVETAAVYRHDPASGKLVPMAYIGGGIGRHVVFPRGVGAVGLAVKQKAPVATANAFSDARIEIPPDFRARVSGSPYGAALAVPLLVQERVLGAFVVLDRIGRVFDAEEIELARAFADFAAVALESARLHEEAERKRRAAEALAEVGRLITQSLDFGEVSRRIVGTAQALLGARSGAMYLLDPDTGDLVQPAYSGEVGWVFEPGTVFPKGTGVVGLAMREGRAVFIGNVLESSQIVLTPELRARVEDSPLRSVVAAPLIVEGKVIGALAVAEHAGRLFDESDADLVQAFADQAAIAIRNSQSFARERAARAAAEAAEAEAERRQREAESLVELGRLVSRSLEPRDVAARIVDGVRSLIGVRAAALFTPAPSGDLYLLALSGEAGPITRGRPLPSGRAVSGRAVAERVPVATPDLLEDPTIVLTPEMRAGLHGVPFRSVLALPLLLKDRVLGALALRDHTGRVFTGAEIRLAQAFADHAAIALENSRLYEEAEQRRRHSEALLAEREKLERRQAAFAEIVKELAAEDDFDRLFALIGRRACELVEGDTAVISLVEGDEIVLRGTYGAPEPHRITPRRKIAASRVQRVIEGKRPFVAENMGADPVWRDSVLVRDLGFPAIMEVPIVLRGEVIGVLGVLYRAPRTIREETVALLVSFAEHTALALDRTNLLKKLEARLVETKTLLAVSRAAGSTLEVGEVARRTLQALVGALGANMGGGWLRDERTDRLVPLAAYRVPKEIVATIARTPECFTAAPLRQLEKIVFASDSRNDPRFDHPVFGLVPHTSLLLCPVRSKGVVVGGFAVFWLGDAHLFTPEEIRLVEGIVGQAAIAIENARLLETEREARARLAASEESLAASTARLTVLREIDQAIVMARSAEDVATVALRHLHRLAPCERASAIMFDAEAQEATLLVVTGSPGSANEQPLRGVRIFGNVDDLKGDFLGLADLRADTGTQGHRDRPRITVPLVADGEPIGVLNLLGESPGAFTREHVDIVREVAGPLAVAIRQAHLHESVNAARQRLEDLSRRLVEIQETERHHLARELHDEIGQLLTGLKLSLGTAGRSASATLRARLAESSKIVGELMTKVRDLSLDLRPTMLDDLGLVPALLWHFERYTAQTKVHVTFHHTGVEGRRFSTGAETATYRIVQEALTNAARHARVKEVTVRLWADASTLGAQIEDRGVGFGHRRGARRGSGLDGMKERAALLGGTLRVEAPPDGGVRVTAELPVVDPDVTPEEP